MNKNDFDKCFMSAEYKGGYEKGYAKGLKNAAICLLIVGLVILFWG